jgi:hypothetical protein
MRGTLGVTAWNGGTRYPPATRLAMEVHLSFQHYTSDRTTDRTTQYHNSWSHHLNHTILAHVSFTIYTA